ncbi:MAG TPA: hypothetical protein VIP09_07785 [Dehalococcoidia bacterium]|jgi:hypothetical protein
MSLTIKEEVNIGCGTGRGFSIDVLEVAEGALSEWSDLPMMVAPPRTVTAQRTRSSFLYPRSFISKFPTGQAHGAVDQSKH